MGESISVRSTAKERLQTVLVGSLLTLVLLAFCARFITVVDQLNSAAIAAQVALLPNNTISAIPVIVEVDEKSLAAYGQWPWPRYQVARLLEAIGHAGASAVGIDALFVEPDRTSPAAIRQTMQRDFNQQFPLDAIDKSLRDYDAVFADTLKSGPFVLSYFFRFDASSATSCQPKSAGAAWFTEAVASKPSHLPNAHSVICNIAPLQQAANYGGFINSAPDSDGIYRKTPMVIEYKGHYYPSLALQTFLTAQAIQSFVISPSTTGILLQIGKMRVPLDSAGNLFIQFPPSGQSFQRISAYDVLSGQLPAKSLQGKIVFVGFSAVGLHEFGPTPYSSQFLGVELHASVLDNLARQAFLSRPAYAQTLELWLAAFLGVLLLMLLANAGPLVIVGTTSFMLVVLFAVSQLLLAYTGIALSPVLPVMTTLLAFLTLTSLKYAREYLRVQKMAFMVSSAHEGIIQSLSSMSEFRDPETGAHIQRTQNYVKALAQQLQSHPKYHKKLTDEVIDLFFKAAPLHDIGKVGIRDHILLKAGSLNEEEFEIMKSHPQIGAKIIQSVAKQSGMNLFMQIAHQICLSHQEKWDGSGYPQGLSGEQIPLVARLMALADVYDALISKRVYKPAFSHQKAISIIRKGNNAHFDPVVVEAFEVIHEQFRDIALCFLDSDQKKAILLADED